MRYRAVVPRRTPNYVTLVIDAIGVISRLHVQIVRTARDK